MSSSVLHGDIPFTCFHPNKPLHRVPPRIFGYVCFVHDLTPGLDKLSPKSIKCVFLGYSRTQKEYRCLDPLTKHHYTVADITFFESQSYFSPLVRQSPDPTLLPILPPISLAPTPKPLQVYTRRSQPDPVSCPPSAPPHAAPEDPTPTSPALPIAPRKGTRTCTTKHRISNRVSFDWLGPTFRAFAVSLLCTSIPTTYSDAYQHPVWWAAMDEDMSALTSRGTWELVSAPPSADIVSCRWVFTLKYLADGTIDR